MRIGTAPQVLRSLFVVWAVTLVIAFGGPLAAQEDPASEQVPEEPSGEEMAEEAEEAAEEEAPVEDEGILDEIVVTAQKRIEDVKQVPISMSTLDTEELELLTGGGADVRFVSGRIPSVVVESSFGRSFPRFYIRGLGNTDFDLNASQPVSMVYDDVVLENPIVKGMPVWDIEQTEVLRGPQGTLFGRNTPAGIVKFDSVEPTEEFDSFLRVSYGTFDTIDLKGAVGGPLTDTLSTRFSGLFQSRSDWIDNGFTGESDALGGYDNYAYRLQFLWEPTDRFRGLLNLHGWDVDGTARVFRANIIEPGTDDLVDGFDQDEVFHDGLNEQDIESQGGVLELEYELGPATLTSITGYESVEMFSRGDIDGGFGAVFAPPFGPGFIPFFSETADGLPDHEQITQELRLTSTGDGPFNWLVGLFYFDEELTIDTFSFNTLAPGNPQDGFSFQRQDAEAWALFGSVDYQLMERLIVKAGLRYSEDEKDFSAERPDPTFNTPTAAPITESTDAGFTSWDVSATYTVNDAVNVYGRVATSFRAPSIQGRILFCPDFEGGTNPETNCVSVADEEEILSGEVGLKSELLDRRLRLNLATYLYEMDGQQLVAVGGEFNTARLLNADTSEGYGFEADVEFAPSPAWFFKLGGSFNHTEIQDPDLEVTPCGGGCTVLDPTGPDGGVLVDGNSLPHAPEWILNGIIDYRRPVGNGVFVGSVDLSYYDEKSFFLYESEEFRADAFEAGLRLGYTFDEYEVALYGRNVTDEEIVRNGIDFNNLTGMTNDPAVFGLELVARF